jgi:asparagine synthase (glutamine-hydrolysing)
MSGFVGICSGRISVSSESLSPAIHATVYSHKTATRNLLQHPEFVLAQSYFPFLQTCRSETKRENISAWVDGEIFNFEELKVAGETEFSDCLLRHYHMGTLAQLLPKVNGIFVAILFDEKKHHLLFITDRYGLKPFYYYHQNGHLILAPEVKCFPEFKSFQLEIRKDVVDCFLQLEHFLGNETWLKHVDVAAPSMIYSFDLVNDKLSSSRYWSWSRIQPAKLTLNEAAEKMGDLLDRAVKKRFESNVNVGVALSGGLDSRALVAAIHQQHPVTYTFGTPNSRDLRIAREVSRVANVKHFHFDTFSPEWLTSRLSGVWKTDGMLNMLHMHYSHLMEKIPVIMDINLSGFLGDAVLGGTYLEKKGKSFLDQRISPAIARHYYGAHYERCDLTDSFFDLDKIDPYLFYNRGRRMIGMGAEEPFKTVPQRLPFMDTALMDLSYSLPDSFRAQSRVYNLALLRKYPQFYLQIPHATTGVPIAEHPTLLNKVLKKYNRLTWIVKYKLGMQTSFVNVQNWIKLPETSAFIKEILDPSRALYPSFTNHDYYHAYVIPHLQGKANYVRQIMGALTLEVWFQQILNKKFRPSPYQDK